jgi:hypothetical protein
MARPRTWQVPVRGRFTFTPSERQRSRDRGLGFVPRRPVPQGDPVEQEIIVKGSCYFCARADGRHHRGCPRFL